MSEVTQSCPALCDPMDCSLQGSSVHGIFQARTLQQLPSSTPGNLPDPGIERNWSLLSFLHWQADYHGAPAPASAGSPRAVEGDRRPPRGVGGGVREGEGRGS